MERTPAKTTPSDQPRKEPSPFATSLPEPTVSEDPALRWSEHIRTVSILCQASNETSSPESAATVKTSIDLTSRREDMLISACNSLGVTPVFMKQWVHNFFTTFTSFRLFREPQFFAKLVQIPCELQVKALLGAMFAFSCTTTHEKVVPGCNELSASDFADLAITYVDSAMAQCGDDPPPLCLLQALILVTQWLIIRGVRGRAWRYLGLCIRVAYELGLHCVDAGKDPGMTATDAEKWCEDEERRRAYWALWEMDQYTNHLKHIPITIDWTQNKVYLPAEDDKWFRAEPHQSCFLEPDLNARSKVLQATGSTSSRAWYIVLASFDAEAYSLAYPNEDINRTSKGKSVTSGVGVERAKESSNLYSILSNAIQLCIKRLPQSLKFHGQLLDFGTRTFEWNEFPSVLHIQSSIYLLALIPEVSRLLALRPYVFEAYLRRLVQKTGKYAHHDALPGNFALYEGLAQGLEQCCNASDAILNVVVNCHESHHQYVSPYIASASWLAATVQLLLQELIEDASEKGVIRSKFEALKAVHNRFTQFWEMSTVPKQNLDALAVRLKQFTDTSRSSSDGERTASTRSTTLPHVVHPSNPDSRGCELDVDGSWHCKGTAQGKNMRWNSPLVYDAHFDSSRLKTLSDCTGQSTDQNMLGTQYPELRSVSEALTSEAALHQPNPAPTTGFGQDGPNLFSLCQNPKAPGVTNVPLPGLDSAISSRGEVEFRPTQTESIDSDPLDWFSFSTDMQLSEKLSDYLEVFSGPWMG